MCETFDHHCINEWSITILPFFILERLFHTWVLVSNDNNARPDNSNICGEIKDAWNEETVKVSCDSYNKRIKIGRYVKIQRKSNASYQRKKLNLCEVEVFSCPPDKWGVADCSHHCGPCRVGPCRLADGYCNGCKFGFWGIREGNIGDCTKTCGKCHDYSGCWKSRGNCPNGCNSGWWGDISSLEGVGDCTHECSHGCRDNVCGRQNGSCTKGCADGYWGPACKTECHCLNDGPCSVRGECPDGCAPGYWGAASCQNVCNCGGKGCNGKTGECENDDAILITHTPAPVSPVFSQAPTSPSPSQTDPENLSTTSDQTASGRQVVSPEDGGDDTGLIAGVVVAIIILLLIIVVVSFLFIR